VSPEDFPDHPSQLTRVSDCGCAQPTVAEVLERWKSLREAADLITADSAPVGPRKPFFPPHLVVGRGRR
jgi:hypothetical protein